MTNLTIVGRLTDQPDIKFTKTGKPVANFTVAESHRVKNQQGEWADGPSTFWDCTLWGDDTQSLAELEKGCRVIVTGRSKTQQWQNQQGENRSKTVIDVDEVGPTVKWQQVTARKAGQQRPAQQNYGGNNNDPSNQSADNPF